MQAVSLDLGGWSVTLLGGKKRRRRAPPRYGEESERGRIADPPILTSGHCNPAHRRALI